MPVIDDLKAYWSLDEASGGATDAHGGHHMTDHNSVGATTGKVSGARDYNGSNQYHSLSDHADISPGDIDYTLAGWAYFDATGSTFDFLSKWDSAGNNEYLLRRSSSDRVQFIVSHDGANTNSVENTTVISANTWYFIAARHDSVNNLLRLRIDTVDATPSSQPYGSFNGAADLLLGAIIPSSPTNFLNGRLDEWGLWQRHLSDAELDWLYNSGNGRSYTDIVNEAGGATKAKVMFGRALRFFTRRY